MCLPSGIAGSEADYCAVGSGFESRGRHGWWNRAKFYCHLYGAQSYANDKRPLALFHEEFHEPRSGLCRSVPLRHGVILNSYRAASFLVRLVEGEERWEAPDHLQGALPQNWGRTQLKRTVTCMRQKATSNDSHTASPLPR
ncbi:hypothetical protein TNCV_3750511 [Trichonephila clavipes]|nr:hypothetical protein TNCV_3750511 [Trichonephila clavipes]